MIVTRRTKRKFKAVCNYTLCWIIVSIFLAVLENYGAHNYADYGRILFMTQFAILMGLSHGIYDIVILKDEMDCRPVWKTLLVRSFYFLSAICDSLILCILIIMLKEGDGLITEESLNELKDAFLSHEMHSKIILFFIIAHTLTFIRSVHKKFGSRVFWNTLLGKSQEPMEENRVFMFIDLRHSTTIAEELGHVKYSSFMKDYYKLLSNCCEENLGEIYQIAGDGAFLTWQTSACKNIAKPIDCFYDFVVCLSKIQHKFVNKYGIAPSFKAGAHCGKVISTEVGNYGSEMAYHGDVLNTTARIQDLCGRLGQKFLISEDLYNILPKPLPHNFLVKKEGFFELRGKKHENLIFSLSRPLTTPNA